MRDFSLEVEAILEAVQPEATSGSYNGAITGIASLQDAQAGQLSFLGNSRYEEFVAGSGASILLLGEGHPHQGGENQLVVNVKRPSLAFAKVCELVEKQLYPKPAYGIHPSAVIDRDAQVGAKVFVGPMCVIEKGAQIKEGAILTAQNYVGANALVDEGSLLKAGAQILDDCKVGKNCILHSGVVVGSDGFGFEFENGGHKKVPQIGNVEIEDNVEIGANTAIDRARFGTTKICQGTKVDNLVQIAHNVEIGKHCLVVAQGGIAGSTTLEDYVVTGGQAGVAGHLRLGAQTQVAAQAGVLKNLPPQSKVAGTPASDLKQGYKIEALKRRLPELFERLKALENQLEKEDA